MCSPFTTRIALILGLNNVAERTLLVFFLFIYFTSVSQSQSEQSPLGDSVQDSLQNKMEHLTELSIQFISKDPEKTKQYAQEALSLALKSKNRYFEGRAYTNLGHYFEVTEDLLQSVQFHLKALEIARSLKDKKEEARCYYNLGNIYMLIGNFESAFEYTYQALDGDVAASDSAGILDDYNRIGQLHLIIENIPRASMFFRMALKVALDIRDTASFVYLYSNIALGLEKQNNIDSAVYYNELAYKYSVQISNNENTKGILYNLANLYIELGYFVKAEQAMSEAKNVAYESQDIKAQSYATEARYLKRKGKWRESQLFALNYFNQATKIRSKPLAYDAAVLVSEISFELKEFEKSHHYLKLALEFKDSLINQSNIQKFEAWDYNHQLKTNENKQLLLEMALLQKEKRIENQKYWITVCAALILSLGIIVFFDQRVQRQQKKYAKHIETKNKILLESLANVTVLKDEMQNMMYHTAHDLKSPLNTIQGSLHLLQMKSSIDQDDQRILAGAEKAVLHGQDFIQQLLGVYLDEHAEVKSELVQLPAFLEEKSVVFASQSSAKNIRIDVKPSETFYLKTDSYLLSRVLDNLISNAIKFSMPSKSLLLAAWQSNQDTLISVQDQGPGFSTDDLKKVFQKFQRLSAQATAGEKSHGLGLSSVKSIMEKLGGEVELKSKIGEGSIFLLRFKHA